MPIRLCDPTVAAPERQASAAPRLKNLEGLRIGLLANGKVNSPELLHATARLFEERLHCTVVADEDKRDASRPCSRELLEAILARADFLITAAGD